MTKDSGKRDYSHKTSKGVAMWQAALAVELVKQARFSKEESIWSLTKASAVQRTLTSCNSMVGTGG